MTKNLKKSLQLNIFVLFFWSRIAIFLSIGLSKGRPSYRLFCSVLFYCILLYSILFYSILFYSNMCVRGVWAESQYVEVIKQMLLGSLTDAHYDVRFQAGFAIKNPPKKTTNDLKNPLKMFFCCCFFCFLKFLIFYENNTTFSLWNRFFVNKLDIKYHLFTKKE
jgi:hypothetical protein